MDQVIVTTHVVSCEGEGDSAGHPRIYLNLGAKGHAECPYCSRRFILRETELEQ